MRNVLSDIKNNIHKYKKQNEEAVRQSIILRILQKLQWEVFDIEEVYPEYKIGSLRVDYALRNASKNFVFLEVKRLEEELERHQEQLLNYSFQQGVKLAVLTNGIEWWFYLPLQAGPWEQRKFYAIDLNVQELENIEGSFNKFLLKKNVIDGTALDNAQKIYESKQKSKIIKENIPKAWEKLINEKDDILIDLLAETTEKICGYKPSNNDVIKFINSFINYRENETVEKSKKIISKRRRTRKTYLDQPINNKTISSSKGLFDLDYDFTKTNVIGFDFLGESYSARTFKEVLVGFVTIIFNNNRNEFDKITNVMGTKNLYFSSRAENIRRPYKIEGSKYYVETNLSANNIREIIKMVLSTFGYSHDSFKIKLT